jgi:hypothetical protein
LVGTFSFMNFATQLYPMTLKAFQLALFFILSGTCFSQLVNWEIDVEPLKQTKQVIWLSDLEGDELLEAATYIRKFSPSFSITVYPKDSLETLLKKNDLFLVFHEKDSITPYFSQHYMTVMRTDGKVDNIYADKKGAVRRIKDEKRIVALPANESQVVGAEQVYYMKSALSLLYFRYNNEEQVNLDKHYNNLHKSFKMERFRLYADESTAQVIDSLDFIDLCLPVEILSGPLSKEEVYNRKKYDCLTVRVIENNKKGPQKVYYLLMSPISGLVGYQVKAFEAKNSYDFDESTLLDIMDRYCPN